jgi:imidazolonepropionase-like amidohydrolase
MSMKLMGVLALLIAAALLPAGTAIPQTQTLLAITGVNVVDVVDGRIAANRLVTISGDTIVSVTATGTPRAGAQIVDGRGAFLIPGLWDMHGHLEATGESSLQLYVANGVTGVRDMGSNLDIVLGMRDATAARRVIGPRIFAAGPILDNAPGDWPFRLRVKTADEGRSAVQMLKRRGVDLIKVHDNTPREVFFAIVDEARKQNLPVAGHVPRGLTAEQVIDAGQGDIEHLANNSLWNGCSGGPDYRRDACRTFFEMLARRHIWQTPTLAAASEILTIGTSASELDREQIAYASRFLREQWAGNQKQFATPDAIQTFRARARVSALVTADMAAAGVGILAGCDAMIAGFCVHDELAAMVKGGMTPLAALQTATINPARYFGREQTLGIIGEGKAADVVLLDRNPLEDISNIRRIHAVVVAGKLLDRSSLDKLLAQVKAAAQQ